MEGKTRVAEGVREERKKRWDSDKGVLIKEKRLKDGRRVQRERENTIKKENVVHTLTLDTAISVWLNVRRRDGMSNK